MPGPGNFTPLRDGFSTLISLTNLPGIAIFERETTPPPLDGGGPIESASMRATAWRQKDPKTLKGMGSMTLTVMYSTGAYAAIAGQINQNQSITLTWPDGATLRFYGFIDKFAPSGHSEGNLPTAQMTIEVTFRHPTTGAEVAPIFTAGAP